MIGLDIFRVFIEHPFRANTPQSMKDSEMSVQPRIISTIPVARLSIAGQAGRSREQPVQAAILMFSAEHDKLHL
jgi:hypothetical protein